MLTWHERDLTQSAAERFTIPESCILVDYALCLMTDIVTSMRVDQESMRRNLGLTQGRCMAEAVMTRLVEKGMNRQEAHELLRKLAVTSEAQKQPFEDILLRNGIVRSKLSEKEVHEALIPQNYLGTAEAQVTQMVKKTREERRARLGT
jgi:adenylosuccinate lyase